jgi:hypothetical protein
MRSISFRYPERSPDIADPLFPAQCGGRPSVGWNGISQVGNDTGTIPGNARRLLTFQEFA